MQCLHPIDVLGGEDTPARSFSLQYRVEKLTSEDINSIDVKRGEDTSMCLYKFRQGGQDIHHVTCQSICYERLEVQPLMCFYDSCYGWRSLSWGTMTLCKSG